MGPHVHPLSHDAHHPVVAQDNLQLETHARREERPEMRDKAGGCGQSSKGERKNPLLQGHITSYLILFRVA